VSGCALEILLAEAIDGRFEAYRTAIACESVAVAGCRPFRG